MDTERNVAAEKEMREWCVALPKVELHAHLNGSVRNSTLLSVLTTIPHLPPPISVVIVLSGLPVPVLDFYQFGSQVFSIQG